MEFSPKVGKKIREERIRRGWAQTDFADEIGMSTCHYGKIERGKVNMSVDTIYRVAQGLGVLPYELLLIDDKRQVKYILTEEKKVFEGQEYTVYGVRHDDEYYITDVSCDKAAVEQLVEDCNKYNLDPVHLYDIVEDFLVG